MCIFQVIQKVKEGKIKESDARYLFDLFMGKTELSDNWNHDGGLDEGESPEVMSTLKK